MATATFSLPQLFAPLQAFVQWLAGGPQPPRTPSAPLRVAYPAPAAPAKPLRVVRVLDAGTGSGRLVISGRMADVCAELDRLAAQEAA
ncbi:hypothetical protein HHL11_18090 [Ramlibacter sp. G-1-2-2]|uniref:Uncharacterized protein n=1 Tax=Ramlibacter agri TaxID=2728837 RepID=A0A848H522_9BURK|nr:hypothetical protein [Ramlibacter agri]NML45664.1 hypothetical protein [Ramlibacter agri]